MITRKRIIVAVLVLFVLCAAVFYWFSFRPKYQVTLTPPKLEISQKPLLIFSVIGDPESDLVNLKKSLELAKNGNSEFIVLVGDLTRTGEIKQFSELKKVLDEGGLKYYVIPGNHDLYASRKKAGDPQKYFKDFFGRSYNQVLIRRLADQKIFFLFLDNSDEYEEISSEQMSFINENLASNSADLTFVFLHIPIYHPSSDYIMGYRSKDVSRQKDELLSIFCKASLSGLFFGHLHRASTYEFPKELCEVPNEVSSASWRTEEVGQKSGLKMYVAGSVNSSRNWQTPRFLEVKVFENSQFIVSEIEL